MEDTKSEKLSTVFDGLIQDYESLHSSLNEIYNESQNIRILSFNSSIEAARAGTVGKGFRVIANEIKNISEKNERILIGITFSGDGFIRNNHMGASTSSIAAWQTRHQANSLLVFALFLRSNRHPTSITNVTTAAKNSSAALI